MGVASENEKTGLSLMAEAQSALSIISCVLAKFFFFKKKKRKTTTTVITTVITTTTTTTVITTTGSTVGSMAFTTRIE